MHLILLFTFLLASLLICTAADEMAKNRTVTLIKKTMGHKITAAGRNELRTLPILPVPPIIDDCVQPIDDDFNHELAEASNITEPDVMYANKFMFHNIDWADIRMPAPAAIGLMGSLLLSTRQYDPWLTKVKKDTSFSSKLLSSSVVEITKGAYRAFLEAHISFDKTIRRRFDEISASDAVHNVVNFLIMGNKEQINLIVENLTKIKEITAKLTQQANYTLNSFNQVHFFFEELHIACVEQSGPDTSFELTLAIEKLEALGSHLLKVAKFFHSCSMMFEKWNIRMEEFVRSVEQHLISPSGKNLKTIYAAAYLALLEEYRANHVVTTYVEISEKHFLTTLSDARALWGTDPVSLQFELAHIHLATFALLTPADIQETVTKERERYKNGIDLMKMKLDSKLKLLCKK